MGAERSHKLYLKKVRKNIREIIFANGDDIGSDEMSSENDDNDESSSEHTLDEESTPTISSSSDLARRTLLRWDPTVFSRSPGEDLDESLLDEIDKFDWARELDADEGIQEADQAQDMRYENDLWRRIRGGKDKDGEDGEVIGATQTTGTSGRPSLRFRNPGGTVKSAVYINSDEDI